MAVHTEYVLSCEAFLLCCNEAEGVISHPILEYVPACGRCAARLGQGLHEATITKNLHGQLELEIGS